MAKLTQIEFISAIPVNSFMTVTQILNVAGRGDLRQRNRARARLISYQKKGYLQRRQIANGDLGKNRYEYMLSGTKKELLLKRMTEYGTLLENARKIDGSDKGVSARENKIIEDALYNLAVNA